MAPHLVTFRATGYISLSRTYLMQEEVIALPKLREMQLGPHYVEEPEPEDDFRLFITWLSLVKAPLLHTLTFGSYGLRDMGFVRDLVDLIYEEG